MKIVQYPHPALRRVARPLTAIDKQVRMHAAEMLELMYAHKGLGLAANQVALPYQLLVLNPSGDPEQRATRKASSLTPLSSNARVRLRTTKGV